MYVINYLLENPSSKNVGLTGVNKRPTTAATTVKSPQA